jgi:HAE1 family hydrophobic/amphiphilic exporter-1
VAQVDVWGGFNREIRVAVDHERIRALGVSLPRILEVLKQSNVDLPAGNIEKGQHEVVLRAPSEFRNLDQIRNTVVDVIDGAVVTLAQVADVQDTYEKVTRRVRVNGEPGIRVGIRKQAEANTVDVARNILLEIERANREFPQLRIVPVINQGNFIERSIRNVATSVLYGGGFAILVLLFFLRNVRSTLVISLAIPISIIATFTLIYFGGLTLNLMTLGGLALGVGMMVDSSIVVLENIFRRKTEEGESAQIAAVTGTGEVAAAIVASTITTLVIFLPLIFLKGVTGVLFRELAYVIVFSLICALLVALSLVPMLSSKLLRVPAKRSGSPTWADALSARAEAFFVGLESGYKALIARVLDHRAATLVVTVLMLAFSLLLLPLIGTEFLPPSDEGEVRVTGEMPMGTRLALVDRQLRRIESVVRDAVPETVSVVAASRGGDEPEGQIRLSLTPAAQRNRSNTDIADDLRRRLTGMIPGMTVRVRAPQGQFILQRLLAGDEGITVEVRGFDLSLLDALTTDAIEALGRVDGITDIDSDRVEGLPQQTILVDRDKLADLGLSARDVAEVIRTAVAGTKAGEFRPEGDAYRIFVQLKEAHLRSMDEILDLTLNTPGGDAIALRSVVDVEAGLGPSQINRKDQQRLITVTGNVSGRDLGSVAEDVQGELDRIPRPMGYDLALAGNYEEQQKSFRELLLSLFLALILVYMVLACQYESFVNPLIVMFSVPVAAVGVLLTLFLTHTTLNVQSYIGCIMLGGIVVNNAILLVDQASQLNTRGHGVRDAVIEAGRRRLRPILMTSLTTVFGLLPLALGIGEGADAQAPLARAVVGGLIGSTLITLVLIPVMYSLFHPERSGEV